MSWSADERFLKIEFTLGLYAHLSFTVWIPQLKLCVYVCGFVVSGVGRKAAVALTTLAHSQVVPGEMHNSGWSQAAGFPGGGGGGGEHVPTSHLYLNLTPSSKLCRRTDGSLFSTTPLFINLKTESSISCLLLVYFLYLKIVCTINIKSIMILKCYLFLTCFATIGRRVTWGIKKHFGQGRLLISNLAGS